MDWRNPDYVSIFAERLERMDRISNDPNSIPLLRQYYRAQPWRMIDDWGVTYDPRNVERGLPAIMPFRLFPKQIEWCEWVVASWRQGLPGLTEKSRDAGVTWLAISLSCALCTLFDGLGIGFGSRKQEYVDVLGSHKAIFPKGRIFMNNLPVFLRAGFNSRTTAPHMRLMFPETGAIIEGEAGDNIGRGDRKGLYFVDEAAHLERPDQVDSSLSATTNCRMDISSVKGLSNSFAQKRFSPAYADNGRVFTFHWRNDPRKDEIWYSKQVELLDPVVVAQEIDIDYTASVEGVLIPSAWIQSAIDAHKKLNIPVTGRSEASLDVADQGKDKNAMALRKGILLHGLHEWSGKGSDIFGTVERAFAICDAASIDSLRFDSDGLGAGVRGDARKLNEMRRVAGQTILNVTPFRGSASVARPGHQDVKGRTNEDYFSNAKAQAWWRLRVLFQNTHRAVVDGKDYDRDEIIAIDSQVPILVRLCAELIQPTYKLNNAGKIVVDKAPDEMPSPNLADSVMIAYSEIRKPFVVTEAAMQRFAQPKLRQHAMAQPVAQTDRSVVADAQLVRRGVRVSPSALGYFRGNRAR